MIYARGQFATLGKERVIVEIHTEADAQEVKELVLGANPLTISSDGIEWLTTPICSSRARLSVFVRDAEMVRHLTDQGLNTVRLVVKVNGVIKWGGFFDAEGVEIPEDNNDGHLITLNFGDFAPLRLRRYTPEGVLSISDIIERTVAVLGVPVRTSLAHLPDRPDKTYINTNVLGKTSTLYDLLALVGYATCSTVRQWGAIEWVNPVRARDKQTPTKVSQFFGGDGVSYVSKIHNTINYELETAETVDKSAGVYRINSSEPYTDLTIDDTNVGKCRRVTVADRDHNLKALRGEVLEWYNKTNPDDPTEEPQQEWAISLYRRRNYAHAGTSQGYNQHDKLPVIEVVSDPLVFDGRDLHIEVECALRPPYVGDLLSETKVQEAVKETLSVDQKHRSGVPQWCIYADLLVLDVEGNVIAYYVDRWEGAKKKKKLVREWREVAPGTYEPSGEVSPGVWRMPSYYLEYIDELGYNEEFNINSDPHIHYKRTKGVDIPLPIIKGAHRVQLNIWAQERVYYTFVSRSGTYIGALGYKAVQAEDKEINEGNLPEWRRRQRLIKKISLSQQGGEGNYKVMAYLSDDITEGIDYTTPIGTNPNSKAYIYTKTDDGKYQAITEISNRPHEHVIIQSLYALYASRGVAYNVTTDKSPDNLLYEVMGARLILAGYEYRLKQSRCDMTLQPINTDSYVGEEI